MSVALRAHHLLCVLTYVGKGYSEAFVANYEAVAARLRAGEPVVMVEGPDALCAPLLLSGAEPAHCLRQSVVERDAVAREAVAALLGRSLDVGERFTLDEATLERLRQAFRHDEIRSACRHCQWNSLCTTVAKDGYRQVRISTSAR